MREIEVTYAEDPSKNKVLGKVYRRLRDNDFDMIGFKANYIVNIGMWTVRYIFEDGAKFPDESKLQKILEDINLTGIEILEPEEAGAR